MRPVVPIAVAGVLALCAGAYAFVHSQPSARHAVAAVPAAPPPSADTPTDRLPAGLTLTAIDGAPVAFDRFAGKLVIINFWATWCGPCLQEIPQLVAAQTRYGARGLQIVGPAVDDPDAVRAALPKLAMNYPVTISTKPEDVISLMERLGNGAGGLPYSVVVAPDGRIVERQLGEYAAIELAALVDKYLPPAP